MSKSLSSLNVGLPRELQIDGNGVTRGIAKGAVEGRREVGHLGIDGDARADPTVHLGSNPAVHADPSAHGGLSKAVYAYPSEHYPFWETVRAQLGVASWGERLPFGSLGENLTLSGVLESAVWIGDLLRFPDCTLAVSEPRFPGFELVAAMGFPHAVKAMTAQGWCGFYLAVRVPGSIAAGESFDLVPGPREVGITELFRARARG